MKSMFVLLSIVLLWHTVSPFPEPLGTSRIFGGRNAKVGEFPFQASLQNQEDGVWTHRCGSSIIDSRHVISAAHCFTGFTSPDQLLVVAGELNVTDTEDPARIVRNVEQFYVHEDYEITLHVLKNDICLVRIKDEFPFNSVIKPIPIRTESVVPPAICSTSGWGAMNVGTNDFIYPDVLQALDMPYVDRSVCAEYNAGFYWEITADMVCSGFLEGGPNPCSGDSGGGLVCEGQLTGITSWNQGCWNETYLTVFTDVSYHKTWIEGKLTISRRDAGLLV